MVLDMLGFQHIRWVISEKTDVKALSLTSTSARAKDSRGNDVLLFENEWSIRLALEKNKGLELEELAPLDENY